MPSQPYMLLHNLPDEGGAGLTDISDLESDIATGVESVAALIGTTGSGKTRKLIELRCQRYGLYFVTTSDETGAWSSDCNDVFKRLRAMCEHNKTPYNEDLAQHAIRSLLYVRLKMLHHIFKYHGRIKLRDWLLFADIYINARRHFYRIRKLNFHEGRW
ncbi:hypothetical protein BZG36_05004 [Bifiguratus adelaidae]|uniref:Uncharacterized protein n=1 Tax=Bifiguratus adelaidae TaxID=1938954 RepID=A0A261XU68_9FUNG|nr:hypothetical protein BZG36_05004 [Bifiguratus adelaidae]